MAKHKSRIFALKIAKNPEKLIIFQGFCSGQHFYPLNMAERVGSLAHICAYMSGFVCLEAAEGIFDVSFSSSGLRGTQTCAPFALKRTGKLSHSLRHKKPRVQTRLFVAERVGFEPTKPFMGAYTISSRARSTGLRHLSAIRLPINNTLFATVCKVIISFFP